MLPCHTHIIILETSCSLSNILKRSRDFLLYTKKETSRVLFYNKIWMLLLPPT